MASSLRDRFVDRHVGPDQPEQTAMLDVLGFESLDALTDAAVPAVIRRSEPLALPAPRSEVETIAALRALADRNVVATSMIGMGYSDTITPGVIRRNVLENPAWYTAYTPYQPEISQGRLEALLDFQTMVADLTGMDLANASLLDEATAAAEAMAMCRRLAPKGGDIFFLDADCHPQTIAVVKGRAEPLDIEVVVGDPAQDVPGARVFGQQWGSGRPLRADRTRTRRRRPRCGDRRPPCVGAVAAAGCNGRGPRRRFCATLRSSARIRGTACRIHRVPRRPQTYVAGPLGWRVG